MEIVAGSDFGKVYAWHHDGTTVEGWPVGGFVSEPVYSSPALCGVDGDGDLEGVISLPHTEIRGKLYYGLICVSSQWLHR